MTLTVKCYCYLMSSVSETVIKFLHCHDETTMNARERDSEQIFCLKSGNPAVAQEKPFVKKNPGNFS